MKTALRIVLAAVLVAVVSGCSIYNIRVESDPPTTLDVFVNESPYGRTDRNGQATLSHLGISPNPWLSVKHESGFTGGMELKGALLETGYRGGLKVKSYKRLVPFFNWITLLVPIRPNFIEYDVIFDCSSISPETPSTLKPEPLTATVNNTQPSAIADPLYKNIKGVCLMNGKIIEGQILSINNMVLKIQTKDGQILSYSFERDIKQLITK